MELDEDSVQYLLKEAYEISYDKYVQALGPEAVEKVLGAFFPPTPTLDTFDAKSRRRTKSPHCFANGTRTAVPNAYYYQSSPWP